MFPFDQWDHMVADTHVKINLSPQLKDEDFTTDSVGPH
jgi:hypothetical protein